MLKPQHSDKIDFIWGIGIDDQDYTNTDVSPIRAIELEYRSLKDETNLLEEKKHFWNSFPFILSSDTDNLILLKLVFKHQIF